MGKLHGKVTTPLLLAHSKKGRFCWHVVGEAECMGVVERDEHLQGTESSGGGAFAQ